MSGGGYRQIPARLGPLATLASCCTCVGMSLDKFAREPSEHGTFSGVVSFTVVIFAAGRET